jgi:hypothetical protein
MANNSIRRPMRLRTAQETDRQIAAEVRDAKAAAAEAWNPEDFNVPQQADVPADPWAEV